MKTVGFSGFVIALVASTATQVGCSSKDRLPSMVDHSADPKGVVDVALTIPGGENVNAVDWTITGPDGSATVLKSGEVDVRSSLADVRLVCVKRFV
jgi:hypothetical protein